MEFNRKIDVQQGADVERAKVSALLSANTYE